MVQSILERPKFDNLSVPDTANHIWNMLKSEILRRPWTRNSRVLHKGGMGIFEIEPVSTKDFYSMDGFYPEPCYPKQQALMDAIFGTDPTRWSTNKNRFVVLWGMSSGKDQTIAKAFAYAAYWLNCLYDPQAYFPALGIGTTIDLVNFCITGYLAKTVFFKALKNIVLNSCFPGTSTNFFESIGMDIREGHDIQTRFMEFPKNIRAHSLDSQTHSAVGMNVLLSAYDEIGGFAYGDAESCFDTTTKTSVSRFQKNHKAVLISWPRDYNDFMMTKYREAVMNAEPPEDTWVDKASTWEVNLGTRREDFAEEFIKNPESAKRVYMCEIDVGESSYFKYPELIRFNINHKRLNPIGGEKFRTFDVRSLRFKKWFKGKSGVWYFGHIDLAKGKEGGDCAGLCICHNVRGMPVKCNTAYSERLKELVGPSVASYFREGKFGDGIFVDLLLQIRAQPGREVIFQDIINLVRFLQKKRGFDFKRITFDGYQSTGEIQRMKDLGVESEVLSVDKTTKPYDNLKTLVYSGLIDYYGNPILIRELEELILKAAKKKAGSTALNQKVKVDHPVASIRRYKMEGTERGSKDLADALAGACETAIQNIGEFAAWWGDTTSEIDRVFDQNVLLRPELQEKLIQGTLKDKARENLRRIQLQEEAPLVTRGEGNVEEYY